MNVDYYQRQVQTHHATIVKLQEQKGRSASDVADEMKRANAAEEAASRATNASTQQSKLRDAQRHRDNSVRHQKKIADIEGQIAREQGRQIQSAKSLDNAQQQVEKKRISDQKQADQKRERERQQAESKQKQADRKRLDEQRKAERDHERRMGEISGRLTQHDKLHSATLTAIDRLQQLPERITVLFLASNPLDQATLRLDEEARSISEMIQKSKNRDAVQFESRWAVRPLDLLQALNETQAQVVHFSSHGSDEDEIVFQDNEGSTKTVSKEAIVQTMSANSSTIRLVFFNTCYSRGQAEAVVKHVPAAIGMNTSIGDDAARVFSSQFYSAIGFGLSVEQAFGQAKAALMLESIPEDSTPELFLAEGLSGADLVLVRPDSLM